MRPATPYCDDVKLKHEAIDREVSVNSLIEQAMKTFLGEPVEVGKTGD